MRRVIPGFLKSSEEREALAALAARSASEFSPGRQRGSYEKLALPVEGGAGWLAALILRGRAEVGAGDALGWDCYLLRYRPGAFIPPHVDPPLFAGAGHLRLNAIVDAGGRGGVLRLDGEEIPLAAGDAVVFRPDLVRHEVSPVYGRDRLVFSLGCNFPAGP